jgi:hypothetical protein
LAGQGGIFATGGPPQAAALKAAHAELMRDRSLKLDFSKAPPPPDIHFPAWLEAFFRGVGKVLQFIAPAFEWIFVGGVVAVIGALLFFIGREILRSRFPGLFKKKAR